MFDILIKNGRIVDGTGQPEFVGDIGIRNGKIIAVGSLETEQAQEIIDASGLVVSPGFIDVHTHSDFTLLADPRAESQIRQGVTTEVIGQCGASLAPCTDESRKLMFESLGVPDMGSWNSFGEMLDLLDQCKPATNVAAMVGHGNLRGMVMGMAAPRTATVEEIGEMSTYLDQSLAEGAFGMTTGMEYHPGKMAMHDEISALCQSVARVNGLYSTHVRNRDIRYFVGFGEALDIVKESGVRLQISHINPKYGCSKDTMENTLQMINWSRKDGGDVGIDVMLTNWAHTNAIALLPPWANAYSGQAFLELIKSPENRKKLQINPIPNWRLVAEEKWDKVRLLDFPNGNPYVGQTISEIAKDLNTSGWDAYFELLLMAGESYPGVFLTSETFIEDDTLRVLKDPYCSPASDTMALANEGVLKGKLLGVLGYNWTAKLIAHYLRDQKVMSLEEGIRRITSLPASRLGLSDRGRLTPGTAADITIFNLDEVKDNSSFANPTVYAGGFKTTIVNGVKAFADGKRTSDHAGTVLRKK